MGILERFKDIVSSNISDLKDRGEPEEKVQEQIAELAVQLAEIRKQTASVLAVKVKVKKQLDECKAGEQRFDDLAKKAAAAGSAADAKVFLEKKQEYVMREKALQPQYEEACENAEKIKALHNKLAREVNDLNTRYSGLVARQATAEAGISANGFDSSDIDALFAEMEAKADAAEAKADAEKYTKE